MPDGSRALNASTARSSISSKESAPCCITKPNPQWMHLNADQDARFRPMPRPLHLQFRRTQAAFSSLTRKLRRAAPRRRRKTVPTVAGERQGRGRNSRGAPSMSAVELALALLSLLAAYAGSFVGEYLMSRYGA